jgi:hypothetical protein
MPDTALVLTHPLPTEPAPRAYVHNAPSWVVPMGFTIINGMHNEHNVNEMDLDQGTGDLILYRALSEKDWDKHPALVGIREVWITCDVQVFTED